MNIKKDLLFIFLVVLVFGSWFAIQTFALCDSEGDGTGCYQTPSYTYQYEYQSPVYAYEYEYQNPVYAYEYEYQSPGGYAYEYPAPYAYETPAYLYEYQYQSPPGDYLTPGSGEYGTPSGSQIAPGGWGCSVDADCRPNPGGTATCCLISNSSGSHMCASDGGGPYCYNYQYQTPVTYSYEYQTPTATYSYQYEYQYPTPAYATPATGEPFASISATPCTIGIGSSTCNSSVTWTTANLTSNPTEVTRNNPNNTHVSWSTSGSDVSNTVNYGVSTFYVYHNSVPLAYYPITATCVSTGQWNGTSCVAGGSSCDWDLPGAWSSCVNDQQYRTKTCPCAGGCSGSYIEYRSCSVSSCAEPAITADPNIITPDGSATLTWCSPTANCVATATPANTTWAGALAGNNGTVSVSPDFTTSFILTCGTATADATVTVRNKPWFVED